MLGLSLPLIYLVFFFVFYFFAWLFKLTLEIKKELMYSAVLFIIIFMQPNLVDTMISMLSCRSIGGVNWVKADVQYVCWTREHTLWAVCLIIPGLLLWIVILPGIVW